MWGIIPAAGAGSRIQPLAFSKELLPVGNRLDNGTERPRAVSEFLVERMIAGGADKLCFVISPTKTDIVEYYGTRCWGAEIAYVVQPSPSGLCDAIFRGIPFVHPDEPVIVGLPDTIWQPHDALCRLPDDTLSFLLFPVEHPELFDAVSTDDNGRVQKIRVKQRDIVTHWVWGAFKMPGAVYHDLHRLWLRPDRGDEYFGTLVNAWLAEGGHALGIHAGTSYIDTGTLSGYRAAMGLLDSASSRPQSDRESIIPVGEEISGHQLATENRR